jgi:glycerophosphoryl diester phosphodiesterase
MQRVYAHRGSSAAYAENTRAAYLQAIADGADGIECDVHLTRDREVVCHHDATVDRTSNGTGHLSTLTLRQLRRLDFSSWKGVPVPAAYGTGADQLLTLAELIRIMLDAGREIGLAIEVKHPSPFGRDLEDAVLEVLDEFGWDPATCRADAVTVGLMSFDPGSIDHLARRIPRRALCQLVTDIADGTVEGHLRNGNPTAAGVYAVLAESASGGVRALDAGRAGVAGPGVAWVRRHRQTIDRWRQAGLPFRVWTVDEDADIDYLAALGIQELTSNRPAHVKRRLADRARVAGSGGGTGCSVGAPGSGGRAGASESGGGTGSGRAAGQ